MEWTWHHFCHIQYWPEQATRQPRFKGWENTFYLLMVGAGKSHGKDPATGRDENYGIFCYQYTNVTKLKEQEIRILESKRYKSEISCEVLGKRHNLPKTPFPCFLTYKIGGEITPNSRGSSND